MLRQATVHQDIPLIEFCHVSPHSTNLIIYRNVAGSSLIHEKRQSSVRQKRHDYDADNWGSFCDDSTTIATKRKYNKELKKMHER